MKQQILIESRRLFLSYGYHSVTMDDIAKELGISKKTLYENYSSKVKLIECVIADIQENVKERIKLSTADNKVNAIAQIFKTSHLIGEFFNVKTRKPEWELKKYYPKISKKVDAYIRNNIKKYIYNNVQKGIAEGLYRQEVDIRFFFHFFWGVISNEIDEELYPEDEFSLEEISSNHLEYIMRILVTPKGLKVLEEILNNNK